MSSGDKRPRGLKPITKIELSSKNGKLRAILAVVCLVVGIGILVYALSGMLSTDSGWKTVEVSSSNLNCSADFVLSYYLGDAGISTTSEYKQLSALYTEATENAYRIFHEDLLEEGLCNLAYISGHVNETLTVEPALYQALELVQRYENRCLYLGPVYTEYNRIFSSESEPEAASYDPAQNPELVAYIQKLSAFANDPGMIDLELLGNNQVKLTVSDFYLAFAQEYEITEFLDFGWMKNAFIADYLAQTLIEGGFTKGYLASFDGFTRNLDSRGETYGLNLFDRLDSDVFLPAVMHYNKSVSIVYLRNYPLRDQDRWHYYSFSSGRIVTAAIDPADGMSKSATDNIVSYSYDAGCAEILLQLIPVYVADTFAADSLNALDGIFSIWFTDSVLRYNDADLDLEMKDTEGVQYSSHYAGN